ncbi:MAG: PIG-L family deacetylase [Candidatus Omnitrophica bacterium]|nr:PIG-L family deacetylase [Candidatus Omnitrophota bacterium]
MKAKEHHMLKPCLIKKIKVAFFCFAVPVIFYESSFAQDNSRLKELEPFTKSDRVLILAPHPDDEAIACAGIIQEALKNGAKLRIVYLTNGEHNEFAFIVYKKRIILKKREFINLGEVRRQESIKAMKFLGLSADDLIFLGYPDFGTFTIFTKYWDMDRPFRSLLTRIRNVPYKESPSFKAPYIAQNILKDIKKVILDFNPNKIFVSHPADVNVDHKSLYLFLKIALADLKKDLNYQSPKVFPYLVHHVGWPLPRRYYPNLSIAPPKSFSGSQIKWVSFNLTPEQVEKKRKTILYYNSQTRSSAFYLLAFARRNELFGDYPDIDLKIQPNKEEKGFSLFGFSKLFPIGPKADHSQSNIQVKESWVSYAILDEALAIRIEKPEKLVDRFSTTGYLFGYSYKVPFEEMPKFIIVTKRDKFKIYSSGKLIANTGISLKLNPEELIIKVPLEILGFPDFVLASVKAYIGNEEGEGSPVYLSGFRKVNIK